MHRHPIRVLVAALVAGGIPALLAGPVPAIAVTQGGTGSTSVVASGLNSPRGLVFGPDGDLYVAEGGTGGTETTTPQQCEQVPAPVGPYSGGPTADIVKITSGGSRVTVAAGLPSSQTSPALGSLVSGVADVAFIGDQLYGLEAGAGCSHGLAGTANTVFRVNGDGTTTTVADLSSFLRAHPVANPDAEDFEPDGTWYSMSSRQGALYAVEPNHQEVDRITAGGAVERVVDMSATFPGNTDWQGPTAITHKGDLFLGTLGTFPVRPGTQTIFKLTPSGRLMPWATGLTTVLGLAFDSHDRLYALESMPVEGFPGSQDIGQGRVVRIDPSGAQTIVASGLSFPTAMTLGPDGALYVSNFGFGAPPGDGQIVRITV